MLISDKLSDQPSRERILKFCHEGQPEARQIFRAYELAPKRFRAAHMVEPTRGIQLDKWHSVLMEIAGGDLSARSLAEYVSSDKLERISGALVGSLLKDLNAGHSKDPIDTDVRNFLRGIVGERKLQSGSKLLAFADREGIHKDEVWLRREGWTGWLVNPLSFMFGVADRKIRSMVGFGHGDLSVNNILLPDEPTGRLVKYILIDVRYPRRFFSAGAGFNVSFDIACHSVARSDKYFFQTRDSSNRSAGRE